MKRCTPDECEWCEPWDLDVCHGTKARCRKPPLPAVGPGHEYHAGWRYSTVLGGACVTPDKPDQLGLF